MLNPKTAKTIRVAFSAIMVGGIFMSFFGLFSGNAARGYENLDAKSAHTRLADFRIIDVRGDDEYCSGTGHIPGAELIPLPQLERGKFPQKDDKPILVVCRSGARSARAASLLASEGYTNLYNLSGGIMSWNASNLPVEHCGKGRR